MKTFALLLIGVFSAAAMANAPTPSYTLDLSHSKIGFRVSHLGVSKVYGKFNKFEGAFKFDEKKKAVTDLQIKVDATSIDTADAKRDEHLKSPDFFNTAKNPTLEFKGTRLETKGKDKGKLHGELTMNGVTKPVVLDVVYRGQVVDPWGNTKLGFEASGKLNRKEWGITWNKTLDKGGVVVGEEVELIIDGEATLSKT